MSVLTSAIEEYRRCEHGFHHPPWPHSCDGCWCEGESDQREYGWPHDTSPEFKLTPDGRRVPNE